MEESFKDSDFAELWSEINEKIVIGLGKLVDEVICGHWSINELISNEAKIILDEGLDQKLAGSIDYDQLRIEFLSKGIIA
jgi:hypothetical protein